MTTLNCKGKLIHFDSPKIMGILNITEYSFFDGGKYYNNPDKYLFRIEKMLEEGADIIDVGCMATNPFAKELSEEEELHVMETALNNILPKFPDVIFSIDTWRASVAQTAVEMGVSIINDISGGEFDEDMFMVASQLQAPYILMHTSGRPEVMQQKTDYNNLVPDIFLYISKRLEKLRLLGVNDVIVDVGFGFGKTVPQNYTLLKHLDLFKELDCPLFVGLSRKTMLYKLLETTPQNVLNATTIANTIALLNGADILRVHDVKEASEAVKIVSQLMFSQRVAL
ncbi:MAG: dihydropteroate synthase [Bacteroidales bacterium]|jgi:dihydropteroate synthase|nr:dihydropteroate synthase [Bacteroidales bacterium]